MLHLGNKYLYIGCCAYHTDRGADKRKKKSDASSNKSLENPLKILEN